MWLKKHVEVLQETEITKLLVLLEVTHWSLRTNPVNHRRMLNKLIFKLGLRRGLKFYFKNKTHC